MNESGNKPSYWTNWGNEAHGIPVDDVEGIAFGTTIKLPLVRDLTPDEMRGVRTGTRPDLVEKIREYEKTLAAYNAELRELAQQQNDEKVRRSNAYWARRIELHPDQADELRAKQAEMWERREKRADLNDAREAKRNKELAWWEIVADPDLYERALRGEFNKPKQLALEGVA